MAWLHCRGSVWVPRCREAVVTAGATSPHQVAWRSRPAPRKCADALRARESTTCRVGKRSLLVEVGFWFDPAPKYARIGKQAKLYDCSRALIPILITRTVMGVAMTGGQALLHRRLILRRSLAPHARHGIDVPDDVCVCASISRGEFSALAVYGVNMLQGRIDRS